MFRFIAICVLAHHVTGERFDDSSLMPVTHPNNHHKEYNVEAPLNEKDILGPPNDRSLRYEQDLPNSDLPEDHSKVQSETENVGNQVKNEQGVASTNSNSEDDKKFLKWLRRMFGPINAERRKKALRMTSTETRATTESTTSTEPSANVSRSGRKMNWLDNLFKKKRVESTTSSRSVFYNPESRPIVSPHELPMFETKTKEGEKVETKEDRQSCDGLNTILTKLSDVLVKINLNLEQAIQDNKNEKFLLVKVPAKTVKNDVLDSYQSMYETPQKALRSYRFKRNVDNVKPIEDSSEKNNKSDDLTEKSETTTVSTEHAVRDNAADNNTKANKIAVASTNDEANKQKNDRSHNVVQEKHDVNSDDVPSAKDTLFSKEIHHERNIEDISKDEKKNIILPPLPQKSARRSYTEHHDTEKVKAQLLSHISDDFRVLKKKLSPLINIKNNYGEDITFKIGYITANLDTLESNLDKLRTDMTINRDGWNENNVLDVFERINTSNNVVGNLMNALHSYTKPVPMDSLLSPSIALDYYWYN